MTTEERLVLAQELVDILQPQIDSLAKFIMGEVSGEPSQSQGAVDTAIRIIKQLQERVKELEAAGQTTQ